jgi:hypothetical protein
MTSSINYGKVISLIFLICLIETANSTESTVKYEQGVYSISVSTNINMDSADIILTIRDFDNYSRLHSEVLESHIIVQDGKQTLVRFKHRPCIWVLFFKFCKSLNYTIAFREQSDTSFVGTVLPENNNFSFGKIEWEINPATKGSDVLLRSTLSPDFWIPPFIGPYILSRKIESDANETVKNLERILFASPDISEKGDGTE